MKDFYAAFYNALPHSAAHRAFCERAFGRDLGQHGFVDQAQLDLLLRVIPFGPGLRVLDLGCGHGRIAEYLSDCSGAHITGLDYIPGAIEQARARTLGKAERLSFIVGDINQLELPAQAFDLILSIDSIYFSNDYVATVRALLRSLRANGQMAFFYSYGREPWVAKADFPAEKLAPDKTPLTQALQANQMAFRSWDLTQRDYELAQRRKAVLQELQPQFVAEGNLFIYESRRGDAEGVSRAIEEGLHARYLYVAQPDK